MSEATHPRRRGLLFGLLITVVVAMAVGATLVIRDRASSATPRPSAATSSASGTADSSADTSGSPNPEPRTDSKAVADAVRTCTAQVRRGEKVIAAATTGIHHWSEHVQAQTDHLKGKVTATQMEATFKRTKLLGPGDASAWKAATKAWQPDDSACAAVNGADQKSAATLQTCGTRLAALETAMPAARDGCTTGWRISPA